MEYKEWEDKCIKAGFTREFLEEYKRSIEKENKKKKFLKKDAMQTAQTIANYMKSTEMADSVYLFGSFARDDFNEDSDIDLYVIGMTARKEDAYELAENISKNLLVSFVFESDCVSWIEDEINREGIKL